MTPSHVTQSTSRDFQGTNLDLFKYNFIYRWNEEIVDYQYFILLHNAPWDRSTTSAVFAVKKLMKGCLKF